MIPFGNNSPDDTTNQWRYQVDKFVKTHQHQLAAVAWGLLQEWGETQDILGIDLKPTPHFICCSYDAIAQLNDLVDAKIQEILGVIDHYDPTEEVAIIVISQSQVKLIYFKPNPSPPDSLTQSKSSLDELIEQLETQMKLTITET